jgi:hypothetical protein
MVAAAAHSPEAAAFVPLGATLPRRADADRVVELLSGDATAWLPGAVRRPDAGGMRRYTADLRLRLGGDEAGVTTFRKAAHIDLGPVRRAGAGWEVEVSWRAATAAPLFPVFSGRLRVDRENLSIRGLYAPPGGAVGRFADRALLHVAASGTARWLLRELNHAALGAAG